MTMKIESNTYNLKSFFDYVQKNNLFIYFPELQRPLAWTSKKVESIFKCKSNDYFGNITIDKQGNKLIILDGQQRISFFLCIYNSCKFITNNEILFAENIDHDDSAALKVFYSSKYLELNDTEKSNILNKIEKYGYIDNFKIIHSRNYDEKNNLLENSFCSFSIINNSSSIDRHDIFISLNHLGQKLCEIDILKAFFLKNMSLPNSPTLISKSWNNITKKSSMGKQKLKLDIDSLLVRYISQYKRGVVKKDIIPFFEARLEETKNAIYSKASKYTNLDSYINNQVQNIEDFILCFIDSIIFQENESCISNNLDDYVNTISGFLLNNKHIYKAIIPLIIHYSKFCINNGSDKLNKFMQFAILALYLTIRNKNNKSVSQNEFNKFIQGNNFKNRVEEYFNSYFISDRVAGVSDLYFIFDINDDNKYNVLEDDKAWNELAKFITNFIFKGKQKITKNLKILLEWFVQFNDKDFFAFKNQLMCEHFVQNIPKLGWNKITDTFNVNFIEREINTSMDYEIDQFLKNNDFRDNNLKSNKINKFDQRKFLKQIINIKKSHYCKSKNMYAIIYAENYEPNIDHIISIYQNKLMSDLKETYKKICDFDNFQIKQHLKNLKNNKK